MIIRSVKLRCTSSAGLIPLVVTLLVAGCSDNAFWPQGLAGASFRLDGSVSEKARTVALWASPGREGTAYGPSVFARFLWKPFSVDEISVSGDQQGNRNWLLRWVIPAGGDDAYDKGWAFAVEGQKGTNHDGEGWAATTGFWLMHPESGDVPLEVIFERVKRKDLERDRVLFGLSGPGGEIIDHCHLDICLRLRGSEEKVGWCASFSVWLSGPLGSAPGYLQPVLAVEHDSMDGTKIELMTYFGRSRTTGQPWGGKINLGYGWMRWGEGWTIGLEWVF